MHHKPVKDMTRQELETHMIEYLNAHEVARISEINVGGNRTTAQTIGKILRELGFHDKNIRAYGKLERVWTFNIDAAIDEHRKVIREHEADMVRLKSKKAENWMKNLPYFNGVVEYAATHEEICVDDVLEHLELLSEAGAKPNVKKILDALGIPQVEVRKKIYRRK